jgi:hypothetical protein
LYDPAINIHIISYLLTQKKRKEREKSVLFWLYDSAINIHVFMLGIFYIISNILLINQ